MNMDFFKGKRITQMGLGLLGRGKGDAEFMAKHGAELIITDLKTDIDLKDSVEYLSKYPNITFRLGEHNLEDFRGRDLIVKGAGVPMNSIYIKEAEKWQIPITMSVALFAKLSKAICIGITGTKGKTTVTHIIHHLLKESVHRVYLGGNERGLSTLALLDKVQPGDFVVLELDSWILQGFGYEKISPHIAVFTNFMPDHMTYYNNDMELYWRDKSNIFRFQNEKDHLILTEGVTDWCKKLCDILPPQVHIVSSTDFELPETLSGEHNRLNTALAIEAVRQLGLRDEEIKKHLKTFPGVPGRMFKVRSVGDVTFYNDTTATVPEATLQALRTLGPKTDNLILIMGGADKSLSLDALCEYIRENIKTKVFLLDGTATQKIVSAGALPLYEVCKSMKEAVEKAYELAKPKGIVLMSPACASFGMFKNEYDRGDQFDDVVKSLK